MLQNLDKGQLTSGQKISLESDFPTATFFFLLESKRNIFKDSYKDDRRVLLSCQRIDVNITTVRSHGMPLTQLLLQSSFRQSRSHPEASV